MSTYTIQHGDCLDIMASMPECSVDSIVTDPPYGLSFMGRDWDHGVPGEHFWREALRVAKPGAHLVAFGGTRTYHRLTCAIEDAGWDIRDCLGWLYGSGFPKSLDVSKAIDKAAGAEREVIGTRAGDLANGPNRLMSDAPRVVRDVTAPATPDAIRWQGWGTALKPAWEPIILARKPLTVTVAANVQKHGTGALNIDGCRVAVDDAQYARNCSGDRGHADNRSRDLDFAMGCGSAHQLGRWPANIVHDGSDEVLAVFPQQTSGANPTRRGGLGYHGADGQERCFAPRGADSGSAARFFYCAKASKADRDEGLDGFEEIRRTDGRVKDIENPRLRTSPRKNIHPTVKPTDLMRWLVRLVTPPDGVVLDPFMGSGSTGKAAMLEGFGFIGCDLEAEHVAIAEARIAHAASLPKQGVLL